MPYQGRDHVIEPLRTDLLMGGISLGPTASSSLGPGCCSESAESLPLQRLGLKLMGKSMAWQD